MSTYILYIAAFKVQIVSDLFSFISRISLGSFFYLCAEFCLLLQHVHFTPANRVYSWRTVPGSRSHDCQGHTGLLCYVSLGDLET